MQQGLKIHHIGYVVSSIEKWERSLIAVNKIKQVDDSIQQASLALYQQSDNLFIELIQPLCEKAFTWNALQKKGGHYHHICYSVSDSKQLNNIITEYNLIPILGPVPAVLFSGLHVSFFYTRNKEIVEFLIENS